MATKRKLRKRIVRLKARVKTLNQHLADSLDHITVMQRSEQDCQEQIERYKARVVSLSNRIQEQADRLNRALNSVMSRDQMIRDIYLAVGLPAYQHDTYKMYCETMAVLKRLTHIGVDHQKARQKAAHDETSKMLDALHDEALEMNFHFGRDAAHAHVLATWEGTVPLLGRKIKD